MLKGWKVNVDWRAYYETRQQNIEHLKQMERAVATQEENLRTTKEAAERARKHQEECHAQKVASGEIPDKTALNG